MSILQKSQPYRVLCVCLGNICRSPTAEVILKHVAEQSGLCLYVDSAGTSNYHPNEAPDHRSQKYARARGYDLSSLRARQIQLKDFTRFNLILAMDATNLKDLQQLKAVAKKTLGEHHVLAELALMSEHDPYYTGQAVPDPYYGDEEDFIRVIDQCESSAKAWVEHLQKHHSPAFNI